MYGLAVVIVKTIGWENGELSELTMVNSVHLVFFTVCGWNLATFLPLRKMVQLFINKRAPPYLFVIPLQIQWGFLADDVIHSITVQIHP